MDKLEAILFFLNFRKLWMMFFSSKAFM